MADAKTLTRFTIKRSEEDYSLHIEDDAGETIEFTATADQLELISDQIDDMLEEDDSLDAVEDDEQD